MGRSPCCDMFGVKKGAWTLEEDLILLTYIQGHGPGNWRNVPIKTGLQRCSKSYRLRWTNYLRPGIKRGNFTESEEKMIIDLQGFLGNRWAAIASYLPQQTDNDIKNYWNTHLKKKLKKIHVSENEKFQNEATSSLSKTSKGQWEKRLQTDIQKAKQALCEALCIGKSSPLTELKSPRDEYNMKKLPPSLYALSTKNIERLLPNWIKNSPKVSYKSSYSSTNQIHSCNLEEIFEPNFNLTSSISLNYPNTYTSTPDNNNLFQGDKSKVNANQGTDSQESYTIFDNWLLDDCDTQRQRNLIDIPFPGGLF